MKLASKTFKAAVLFKQNKKLKVIDIRLPSRLKKGQVLVKVISASICGAQIGEIKGNKGPDKWLPHCMGHEGYGLVIHKNKSVKTVKKGDHVIMHWRKGSGINAKPPIYNSKFGNINAGQITTFQEYSVVSENRLTKINKISKKNHLIAPLLGCAIPTSWGILNNELKINSNQKYLIFGAGGIGINIALFAKLYKVKNLLVIDRHENKKKYLNKIKVKFLNIKKLDKIKNNKYDKVIDTTGSTNIISKAFNYVDKNGQFLLVGQPKKNSILRLKDPLKLFNPPSDNIKIFTSDGGLFEPQKHMNKIVKIFNLNKFKFKNLVSHTVSLDEINKGIYLVMKGKAARVSIRL